MPKPVIYRNLAEATAAFESERPIFEERGVSFLGARAYLPENFRRNYKLAMDAQPAAATDPNSAVLAMLTTYIDPNVFNILFSPLKAARVLSEERKGDWLMETAAFPVVEHSGEVSSYGDYNNSGRASANTNWPQRQAYLFQSIVSYGDRELERAGLARINWVSELNRSAADLLNRFQNLTYLYGVQGLANYGMINDPNLPAPLTPAPKANGGVTWFTSGGAVNATANEVYNDIVSIFEALVTANQGLIDKESKLKLVMSPGSSVALTFTNTFNVNVEDLLKKNFPNLTIETVPQYGTQTTANSQGNAAGNLLQMIADDVDGQKTGFCAFNEKLKSFPIVREMSAYKQKQMSGTWGSIIRMPVAFSQMLGV